MFGFVLLYDAYFLFLLTHNILTVKVQLMKLLFGVLEMTLHLGNVFLEIFLNRISQRFQIVVNTMRLNVDLLQFLNQTVFSIVKLVNF